MLGQRVAFGRFVADMERGLLLRDGLPVDIGQKAFALLGAFLGAPGKTLDKAFLMDAAWPGLAVEESNLSVQIAALRKLLGAPEDGAHWIVTVPRVGYRFLGQVVEAPGTAPPEGGEDRLRPSIAVLPFDNLSTRLDKEYLADGLTDDIITALTRFRWFRVVARDASFVYKGRQTDAGRVARDLDVRYLLRGSIRHAGARVRISVQLIDAASGDHVWAERYDLDFADVFAIQDEIAERVAGAIEPELLRSESHRAAARHTGNMTAWDLVRQGTWHFNRVEREGHLEARRLFRRTCAIDPQLAEAHIWLARVSAGIVGYGWSEDPAADIKEGLIAAAKAIYLDPKDPYAHYAFAITSAYADMPTQAELAAHKAVELSPSFALGHLVLGLARLYGGRAGDAIEPLSHGLRLNPNDPQNFVWFNLLAFAQLLADRPEEAYESCAKALAVRPTWRPTYETQACCLVALGRLENAAQCVAAAEQLEKPEGDIFAPLRRLNPDWQNRIAEMLRQAGAGTPDTPGPRPRPQS